ncbi:ribosome biogenesis protein ytm1 [Cladophialophora chaetospira]|uniref:Ribosome biogenesis protein ytm1 n=1 Tax=Cladophialophora chaetospira TaxID=386627 RepID=A0AA38X3E7_9EURO|nr:ribosome biogenesis protein ytm1 [Cladophialophora chaetospira]
MSDASDAAISLRDAIIDGSFPQSEQLLTSDLSPTITSALLHQISQTQNDLSHEIKENSKHEAGNVDQWIAQAKKVQDDIAWCKLESRRIVEEHQQLQALRDQVADYQNKASLLNSEIGFTDHLVQELQTVSIATQSLKEIEEALRDSHPADAATKLQELEKISSTNPRSRTTAIVRDLKDELRLKARFQLEQLLSGQISVRREPQKGSVEILENELHQNSLNSDAILRALNNLGDGEDATEPLTDKLRSVIVQPLRRSARSKISAYRVEQHAIYIDLSMDVPSLDLVLDFILDFLSFLRKSLSKTIQAATAKALLPELMGVLVSDWLNLELPTDLGMLDDLDTLQQRVLVILDELKISQWEGQKQLEDWIDDIQRAWLNKRKAATLDAVRKAFASAKGLLRQVERVERQVVSSVNEEHKSESDDWDSNWDEDARDISHPEATHKTVDSAEDDTDGWGFDDEDKAEQRLDSKNGSEADPEDEDAGDAWGWGDESPTATKKTQPKALNGAKRPQEVEQEVTLTELYSISEIPDHLIETIGRDLTDAHTLQETQHKSLDSASASRGLLALPTLALAMFRATAPSYYGASPSLTDIHRYNDSLYIAERLRDMNTAQNMPTVEPDAKAMEKFAKMAYSKEMETQRIIIWDLLEGAQGFTSCTQFPYSQEIENAVSSVVDRIRTLHAQWKPILSTSALMQSLGSLVTMVISKVISSIEEMDDISEPESQRLTTFCQQFATLEDLFLSTPPSASLSTAGEQHEAVPMTAVYVSDWLRFQYLINILESSLVDIRYLWTEGELSLEFSADEVVDLIKALFAESTHRRSAIAAIKGSRRSR